MTLVLPKKYLSYSAIDLWTKNKEQYRKRYYDNEPFIETPEMKYGKMLHHLIEINDPYVKKIPRYTSPEFRIETIIDEVPVIGYIDNLCPYTFRFLDYKTGRPKPDGRPRWDAAEVARTDQLPFYSLFLKEKFGEVEDLCHLVWLPTVFKKKTVEFDGHTLEADARDVEWNGEVHMFRRVVRKYEREAMREKIIRAANEISDDYQAYKKADRGAVPAIGEKVLG